MAGRAPRRAARRRPAGRRAAPRGGSAATAAGEPVAAAARSTHQVAPGGRRRLAVAYEVDGPRIRLGLLWFVLEMAAFVAGVDGIAVLFAATAALAATQTAAALRQAGEPANRLVAGIAAAGVALAGAFTTGMVGIAVLAGVGVTLFLASGSAAVKRRNLYAEAGATIRCWLFPGFAAACVVVSARFSFGGALALVVLVAAYESGDYVIGSGAGNPYEGPVAGVATVLVVTFAITAIGVRPLVFPDSFALGALAAVLCPLGQLAGSLVLPRYDSPAGALRRLDSLLLLAPAWALVVGILVQ